MQAFPKSVRSAHWSRLFTNHIDAVGVTLIIVALCTLLHGAAHLEQVPLLLTMTFTAWVAFAVNDYFDAETDALDPFKRTRNFFAAFPTESPFIIPALLVCAGIMALGFGMYELRGLLEYTVALSAIFAYSMPPLRLKNRPLLDLAMHCLFVETAPYYATLFLLNTEWTTLDRVMLGVFFLGSLAAQVEQQTRDYAPGQEDNFAVRVGLRPAVSLLRVVSGLFMCLIIGAFLAGLIPVWFVPFGLIGLPVVLHRFLRTAQEKRSQRLIIAVLLAETTYGLGLWVIALLNGGKL